MKYDFRNEKKNRGGESLTPIKKIFRISGSSVVFGQGIGVEENEQSLISMSSCCRYSIGKDGGGTNHAVFSTIDVGGRQVFNNLTDLFIIKGNLDIFINLKVSTIVIISTDGITICEPKKRKKVKSQRRVNTIQKNNNINSPHNHPKIVTTIDSFQNLTSVEQPVIEINSNDHQHIRILGTDNIGQRLCNQPFMESQVRTKINVHGTNNYFYVNPIIDRLKFEQCGNSVLEEFGWKTYKVWDTPSSQYCTIREHDAFSNDSLPYTILLPASLGGMPCATVDRISYELTPKFNPMDPPSEPPYSANDLNNTYGSVVDFLSVLIKGHNNNNNNNNNNNSTPEIEKGISDLIENSVELGDGADFDKNCVDTTITTITQQTEIFNDSDDDDTSYTESSIDSPFPSDGTDLPFSYQIPEETQERQLVMTIRKQAKSDKKLKDIEDTCRKIREELNHDKQKNGITLTSVVKELFEMKAAIQMIANISDQTIRQIHHLNLQRQQVVPLTSSFCVSAASSHTTTQQLQTFDAVYPSDKIAAINNKKGTEVVKEVKRKFIPYVTPNYEEQPRKRRKTENDSKSKSVTNKPLFEQKKWTPNTKAKKTKLKNK